MINNIHSLRYSLPFVICLLVLTSCNHTYQHHVKDFPNYGWDKNRKLEFNVEIEDISSDYSLTLSFRHIYGFTFEAVPLNVTVQYQGETTFETIETILIFDENNKALSDCAGDYCDIDQMLAQDVHFKIPGTYVVSLEHMFELDVLPYVMEVGIILDKRN